MYLRSPGIRFALNNVKEFSFLFFEGFFVKNPSNSLKTFVNFATMLQNDEKVFEGLRETFFKKFPYIKFLYLTPTSKRDQSIDTASLP